MGSARFSNRPGSGAPSVQLSNQRQLRAANRSAPADVLLVEDDGPSDEILVLVRCLKKAGFSVEWKTLNELLESGVFNAPDVIVLDLESNAKRKSEVGCSILSSFPEKSILITKGLGESLRDKIALRSGAAPQLTSAPQLTWLDKPLDLARLPDQIGCELKKAAIRRAIRSAPNFSPHEVLRVLSIYDSSLPGKASQEIQQEIQAESGQYDMIKDPIDSLYAEIADLTDRVGREPDVEPLMQQKMEHLRRLQAKEAAEMATWFQAQRNLQSGSGYEAIKRAEKLIAHEG